MRKAIEKETKLNLVTPITDIHPDEASECFGIEFEARAQECSICADETLCHILWSETVKTKKAAFEVEHGPLMDLVDFKSVDMAKIEKLARKYESENAPMTFQELQYVIAVQADTKDEEAVIQFIKRELPLTKIFLSEGVCKVRS